MARKRASLKDKGEEILGVRRGGQGTAILFGVGGETGPTVVPGNDAAASEVTPAMEGGLAKGEADLDSLLDAEAKAAEGESALPELATTPASLTPPPAEPVTPPPSPPVVTRPLPAPPPSVPAYTPSPPVETPTPPLAYTPPPVMPPPSAPTYVSPPPFAYTPPPPVVSPAPPSPAPAIAPPSTATGAPDLSVPRPPRYISMVEGDFNVLDEEISPDAVAAALAGVPEGIQLTADQRAQLLRRSSVQKKLVELDRAIEAQYDRILQENVSVSKPITDWCHNMLAEARTIVLNQQVGKLARAEWDVEQVRARLDRAAESQKQANRFAWLITVWGVVWFGVFVYLIFNPTLILQLIGISEGTFTDLFLIPTVFLRSLFFGGVGGVAAVFYHLFKYVRERSFDNQYTLSYIGKPFMGMILGSMIYLTIFVAMRVLGLAPIGLKASGTETVTDVMYTALLFFIAMAAGFKENLAFNLLNRVIKAVLGPEENQEEAASPPPVTTPTA